MKKPEKRPVPPPPGIVSQPDVLLSVGALILGIVTISLIIALVVTTWP